MGWNAQPMISCAGDGWYHVNCPVSGDSVAEVLAGETFILNALAGGKLAVIRSAPNGSPYRDFDLYKGYVRFSFRNEPGEWKYPDRSEGIAMTAFGLPPKDDA